jgi:ParB family transcriptional regulator, chromosome partitioning protein
MDNKNFPKKRNALGRGLGALLEDSESYMDKATPEAQTVNSINEIPLDSIEVNPFQPRQHFDQNALHELAESIKVQGIIQPITVRLLEPGRYQIISGERRFQASKIAGLEGIPAYIRTADDQQMLEMALIENIQRENLNAIEVALSYQRLISECNLKQEALGDRVGKNRATVNNYLRLLRLPPDIQIAIRDNQISMGHARAIVNIDNIDTQLAIFKKIIREELSVRKVEELVRELSSGGTKSDKEEAPINPEKKYEINQLQSKLSSHFGTKISLKSDEKNKGEIKIPFYSKDDLNRILEILNF